MKKIISLAISPGTNGTKKYNRLFKSNTSTNNIFQYEARKCIDIKNDLRIALSDPEIIGINVSMPYKKEVISYLDYADPLVTQYQSCNTIRVIDKKLYGYNADYYGAISLLPILALHKIETISILGNGAMANMINAILISNNYTPTMYARSLGNWRNRYQDVDSIINATGLGTISIESPFNQIPKTKLVIDLALQTNDFLKQCIEKSYPYVSGDHFYKYQILKQFELHTNIKISSEAYEVLINVTQE